jgi:hypothetical protein
MNATLGCGAIGVTQMSNGSATRRHGEVQSELAEWAQVGPHCWERRVREWGSVPPDDEWYGAAEVEKMNEEQREGWQEELRFDACLEAFFEGATEEEIDAYHRGVM